MPPDVDNPTVPMWATNLFTQLGSIDATVKGIDRGVTDLTRELDEVRRTTVPIKEHEAMMQRVDTLWSDRAAQQGKNEQLRKEGSRWNRWLLFGQVVVAIGELGLGVFVVFHR